MHLPPHVQSTTRYGMLLIVYHSMVYQIRFFRYRWGPVLCGSVGTEPYLRFWTCGARTEPNRRILKRRDPNRTDSGDRANPVKSPGNNRALVITVIATNRVLLTSFCSARAFTLRISVALRSVGIGCSVVVMNESYGDPSSQAISAAAATSILSYLQNYCMHVHISVLCKLLACRKL